MFASTSSAKQLRKRKIQDVVCLQIEQMENIFAPQLEDKVFAKFQTVRDIDTPAFIESFCQLFQEYKKNKINLDCNFLA